MKRPLSVVGFSMLLALLILCYANSTTLALVCGLVSWLIFVLTFIFNKIKQAVFLRTVIAAVCAACLLFVIQNVYFYQPAINCAAERTEVSAYITDYPVIDGDRYYVNAKLENHNSGISKPKIRLSFAVNSKFDETLEDIIRTLAPGDRVNFVGRIYVLGGANASIHRSFKGRGMYLGAYPLGRTSYEKAEHKPLSYIVKHERKKAINQIRTAFDSETAGILISILFGDKLFLSDGIYSDFKVAGVAHIMAVSGLHLSVWILFAMWIAEHIRLDKRKFAVFLMLFTLLIMAFACFSGSVMRAGIMMLVYLFGFVLRKEPDSLNSLGFASIVILIINPFYCMNVSFLLSFLATLSIIIFSSPAGKSIVNHLGIAESEKPKDRIASAVIYSVMISIGASVFTFPVVTSVFGSVPTLFILANLLLLPVTAPLIICTGSYVMLYFVPGLSHLLHDAAYLMASYCKVVVHLIALPKFSSIVIPKSIFPLVLGIYSVCVATASLCICLRNKNHRIPLCK